MCPSSYRWSLRYGNQCALPVKSERLVLLSLHNPRFTQKNIWHQRVCLFAENKGSHPSQSIVLETV